ncbi:flagellar biosynthesis anti-sigma factor FlgM [Limnohabitans planktonicus]|uniref:Negative regulator of flagellin synthesis n=1 Tax=Limnohabitans planktonicus II-D5 TaxID=1293045 RepID=A0A2T7UAS5_9BURK|nr:flagellar biosynthesis anti-sigma factor FlgM [Limnohabitans planktonicus]PVE41758.1 flagellar biosynthesis anti-sigma factor FlgM [Limnohabitans planktonicus II-D5]
MKITPLSESHATSSLPTSKVEAAGSGKTPATSKSWVVSLSSAVQSMAHVDTLAGVMNMAKVDSVRAEFQKGTFRVNPEVIADRLLEGTREQLRRQA